MDGETDSIVLKEQMDRWMTILYKVSKSRALELLHIYFIDCLLINIWFSFFPLTSAFGDFSFAVCSWADLAWMNSCSSVVLGGFWSAPPWGALGLGTLSRAAAAWSSVIGLVVSLGLLDVLDDCSSFHILANSLCPSGILWVTSPYK